MKKIALATILGVAVTSAFAQSSPPLSYADLKSEARRIEKLEGSEYVISSKILHKQARLNLRPFGGGSDALYVVKADEVAFVCATGLPKNFRGGWITGRVEKHEASDGQTFFDLSNCRAE